MKNELEKVQKKFKELFFEECRCYFETKLFKSFGYIDYHIKDKAGYFVPFTTENRLSAMLENAYADMPHADLIDIIKQIKKKIPDIYTLEREYIKSQGKLSQIIRLNHQKIQKSRFRDGNCFVTAVYEKNKEISRSYIKMNEVSLALIGASDIETVPFVFVDDEISTIFSVEP